MNGGGGVRDDAGRGVEGEGKLGGFEEGKEFSCLLVVGSTEEEGP